MPRRTVVTADLFGWLAIADALHVHPTTARKWAARDEDPLPVRRLGRRVQARSEDLADWVERNER